MPGILKKIFLLLFIIFSVSSCEKLLMPPDTSDDPVNIFEEIWSFTNTHYSFFEYKGIDWYDVYRRYRPKVNNDMTLVELFDVCAEMLYELRDGHVNLISSFDRSRYWQWYLDYPENFNYSILERNYFNGKQRYVGPLQFVDLGNVIYLYYESFADPVSDGNMKTIITSLARKKGLIIDVRNNGGGSIENARKITSYFTDEKLLVGYNEVKTGPGHNDFRREEVYINPHDGPRYTGEVVVLTNRRSYSATTYFTQYMNALSNVTFIGDATGGGGGMPAFHDLPNGWLLRVSSSRFLSPDLVNIESGIPPHINVNMTLASMAAGRDDILERALQFIKNK